MQFSPDNIAWHTEVGRRTNNEDFCAFQIAPDGSACLIVVADGMGGHEGGEVASTRAVETLLHAFQKNGFSDPPATLRGALLEAHDNVRRAGAQAAQVKSMGTTMVAAVLREGEVLVGHIGDSRALQFRGDCVRRLTSDHLFSVVALGVEENVAKRHPQGNVLSQALGGEGNIEPTLNSFDLQSGDVIVVCSDGVSEKLSEPAMSHALFETPRALPEIAADLARHALRNGSRDNCTVVVASVPGAVSAPESDAAPSDDKTAAREYSL